ncbi:MAG TPA: VWA domain-containing protein [Terriglobales bacterium]|nr:VWA domain-containing protein [Terriglobales bacterium]
MVAFVAAVALSAVFAQEQSAPDKPSSSDMTVRATTHMVVLDVVVTNSSGKHAKDLQQGDFTVLEDGVSQNIVSFEKSGVRKTSTPQTRNEKLEPAAEPQSSSGSPRTILVLDELDTEWILTAQARVYLNKYFATHGPRLEQPTALLALTNDGLEMLCNYSQDARALTMALARHKTALPYHIINAEGVQGGFDRLGIALTAMYQIAQASTDRASRKNLVWIGEGFPVINYAVSAAAQPALGLHGVDLATQEKARGMVQKLANALLAARISVYTVDPTGLLYAGDIHDPRILTTNGDLIFENIAPETGGKIFRNINDVGFLVDKSVRDGSSYYTLAYYPTNKDWNGKFRNISVKVIRPGLEVRTRTGYYALSDSNETPDQRIDLALSIAVRNPVPYTLIPITVSARRLPDAPHSSQLTVKIDRNSLQWSKLPNGDLRSEITLVTASLRDDNRVLKFKVREFESIVEKGRAAALRDVPLVFTVDADVPAKTARLRCIIRDAQSENMGTADLSAADLASGAPVGDLTYSAESGKLHGNHDPAHGLIVGDPVRVAVEGEHLFLRTSDGKVIKATVIKRQRSEGILARWFGR